MGVRQVEQVELLHSAVDRVEQVDSEVLVVSFLRQVMARELVTEMVETSSFRQETVFLGEVMALFSSCMILQLQLWLKKVCYCGLIIVNQLVLPMGQHLRIIDLQYLILRLLMVSLVEILRQLLMLPPSILKTPHLVPTLVIVSVSTPAIPLIV